VRQLEISYPVPLTLSTISMSLVERQKLTVRTSMRRFTRLTNSFSKKVEEARDVQARFR
jgi:hypothetical protein